jgi:hypothetical protein
MIFMQHIQISLNIKNESTSSYSVTFHLQIKVEIIIYKEVCIKGISVMLHLVLCSGIYLH